MKKQKDNKNINNEKTENFLKMKKCKSDYYVTDQNVNYYEVKDYN